MACEHGNDPATCSWCAAMGGINSVAAGAGPEAWDGKVAERVRVERWHATYNAALTGCHGWCDHEGVGLTNEVAHDAATEAANLAHGPLKP